MTQDARAQILQLMEPWAVMAAGVLITGCASKNLSAIDLLKAPVQIRGKISDKAARVAVPKWFPIDESYFEAQDGFIHSRVKDLALPRRTQATGDTVQVGFDLSNVAMPPDAQDFTLTYFPWFRFLSEPISFDASGKVASYIANCFRFILRSRGFEALMQCADDGCVTSAHGIQLQVSGMAALRQLRIVYEDTFSLFDLANRRIELAADMFPAAYEAGRALLLTPDRLLNMVVNLDADRLVLGYSEEATHVQA